MICKFSIIVPVYNVAPWLRECLDSVLAQTYRDWECICVDDGSTDESGAILDEYSKKVEKLGGGGQRKFKVIHQKNAGVSAARNAALEVAQGDVIVFLDGDDCLHADLLDICRERFEKDNADVVMYDKEAFEENHGQSELGKASVVLDISRVLTYEVSEADFFQFAYLAHVLAKLRFPRYIMGEDRLFLAWALVRAGKLTRIHEVGYYYRQRLGSAVNSCFSWRKWRDDLYHSVRRMMALAFCGKHVEWRVYRHQLGLWLNMIWRLFS